MKKSIAVLLTGVLLAIGLAGCVAPVPSTLPSASGVLPSDIPSGTEDPNIVSPSATPTPAKVEFDDNDVSFELRENPTSSYRWQVNVAPEGILRLEGDEYDADDNPNNLVGVGGWHEWEYEAIAAGEATVTFNLAHVGDASEIIETRAWKVVADSNRKIVSAQPVQ